MKARYPVYNAPGMPQVQAPGPGVYNYGNGVAPPPPTFQFSMFNPAALQASTGLNQQTSQYPQPGYQLSNPASTTYPQQGHSQAQPVPTTPSSQFLPPPPLSSKAHPQQSAYPNNSYPSQPATPKQPVMTTAPLPYSAGVSQQPFSPQPTPQATVSPYSGGFQAQQSPSSQNAQNLFSTPLPVSTSGNAQQLFSAPIEPSPIMSTSPYTSGGFQPQKLPASTNAKQLFSALAGPVSGNAMEFFGVPASESSNEKPLPFSSAQAIDQSTVVSTKSANECNEEVACPQQLPSDAASLHMSEPLSTPSAAAVFGAPSTGFNPDTDDEMMDVSLSPKHFSPPTVQSIQKSSQNPAPVSAAASLFGSVGMPPPPFSNKQ
jgi:hypothetical protein